MVGGVRVGFAIGRWWALLAAVGLGVWVGFVAEVEVSSWLLGAVYAIFAGGIVAGVLLRKLVARSRAAGDA